MIIKKEVYARAGLVGNPSDGYFGKTLSCVVKNFRAQVQLFETPELRIDPANRDHSTFNSIDELVEDIRYSGYYGGIRLIKAAIKKFHDYCCTHDIELPRRNFTIRYDSNIPLRVGLAGSSAIVTATMKALMAFYEVDIPKPFLPTLVLRAETEELYISAGLQDRVVQAYGGCVYMDFDREHLDEFQYGRYEQLDPGLLPNLYVAYRDVLSEGTEVVHNDLRARYDRGDHEVRGAMEEFGQLADRFYKALKEGNAVRLSELMNANFDLRAHILGISQANWNLINAARNVEASAKFCGSGGAIVGIYTDEAMYRRLAKAMAAINATLIKVKT